MSTAALDDWNAQFGDIELVSSNQKPKRFEMTENVAYPVKVKSANIVTSTRGDTQLELELSIHEDTHLGDELGTRREWVTLPKQQSDLQHSREVVEKMTQRRYQDMLRIASCAAPAVYALYKAKVTGPEGKSAYKDFNDELLDSDAFRRREQGINAQLVKLVEELREQDTDAVSLFEGAECWLVKASNSKNPKYPYSNWYAKPPRS